MTDNKLPGLLPAALDLPTITSINPGQPPVLELDNCTVVKLADLPAPRLLPETSKGVAVLLTNWRESDAPVYLVPDSLVPVLRAAADQSAATCPPVLVGVELTPDAVICQPAQGRHRVTIPRPCWPRLGHALPYEPGQYVEITIYTTDPNTAGDQIPTFTKWRAYPDTAEGQAVLAALKLKI